jgi:hypothetical protein
VWIEARGSEWSVWLELTEREENELGEKRKSLNRRGVIGPGAVVGLKSRAFAFGSCPSHSWWCYIRPASGSCRCLKTASGGRQGPLNWQSWRLPPAH